MDYNKQQSDLFIELMRLFTCADTEKVKEQILEAGKKFIALKPPPELISLVETHQKIRGFLFGKVDPKSGLLTDEVFLISNL